MSLENAGCYGLRIAIHLAPRVEVLTDGRSRTGDDDELAGDPVTLAATPGFDRMSVAGARTRTHVSLEARPGQGNRPADERSVAGFVRVRVTQNRRDASLPQAL